MLTSSDTSRDGTQLGLRIQRSDTVVVTLINVSLAHIEHTFESQDCLQPLNEGTPWGNGTVTPGSWVASSRDNPVRCGEDRGSWVVGVPVWAGWLAESRLYWVYFSHT
jgi:hypothetical protein